MFHFLKKNVIDYNKRYIRRACYSGIIIMAGL